MERDVGIQTWAVSYDEGKMQPVPKEGGDGLRGWETWGCSACRKQNGDLITVYQYLCESSGEWDQALFGGDQQQDEVQWPQSGTQLNTRKNFFALRVTESWNRLPREVVESSLETFKTYMGVFLCNLL